MNKRPSVLSGQTGLGTSATRLGASVLATMPQRARAFRHVPYEHVGVRPRPDLYMPFPVRLSQHLDASPEHMVSWARAMRILDAGVWSERELRDIALPLCAAGIHPDASADELDTSSIWLTWGTYGDEYYPRTFGR